MSLMDYQRVDSHLSSCFDMCRVIIHVSWGPGLRVGDPCSDAFCQSGDCPDGDVGRAMAGGRHEGGEGEDRKGIQEGQARGKRW